MSPVPPTANPRVVLLAVAYEHELAPILSEHGFSVVRAPTATLAVEWAHDLSPDIILLDSELPDMSAAEACEQLRAVPELGRNVPIVLIVSDLPTPEQRVSVLRQGVWDFLRYPQPGEDIALAVETFLRTRQSLEAAHESAWVDPVSGMHTRIGLARRARELGALMARMRGPLACVVFAFDDVPSDQHRLARTVTRAARNSDVVGMLGSAEYAVLAPSTDRTGAAELARRIGDELSRVNTTVLGGPVRLAVRAGFDAVANCKYSPIDPVLLLARATAAVRRGTPVPGCAWVRHFDSNPDVVEAPRVTPPDAATSLTSDFRRGMS